MKSLKNLMLLSMLILLSGCVTNGNYCDLAFTIKPSHSDKLTPGTASQIDRHDTIHERVCG